MKKNISFLVVILFLSSTVFAQNVGIGIANPVSKLHVLQVDTFDGIVIDHSGNIGSSMVLSPQNVLNSSPRLLVENNGIGFAIQTNSLNNSVAIVNNLANAGGIGAFSFFNGEDGTALLVDSIGDGYGLNITLNTSTPTIGGTISGAIISAQQKGVGHGILLSHTGVEGRNAEFGTNNPANTDPTVFVSHGGQGGAMFVQNINNTIAGVVNVGEFIYAGSDVDDHVGVAGTSTPAAGWGIGVLGLGNWYGMFSTGDQGATGTKTFLIDHPADPENKFIRHFSIESNEVLNMYRGIAEIDANGEVQIQLPDYFELINKDYSYQLTAIGTPQQPYILEEIQNGKFIVKGTPNTKVSWTVHAQRNDPYIQQNPDKTADVYAKEGSRKGKYLNPELYGKDKSEGMFQSNTNKEKMTPSKVNNSSKQSKMLDLVK